MPVPTAGNAIVFTPSAPRCAANERWNGASERRVLSSQLHARGVDHVAGLQISAASDRRAAHRDGPDGIAFLLNAFAAFAQNRPGHAAAKLEIIVGGIDDGVGIHFRQIALRKKYFLKYAHRWGRAAGHPSPSARQLLPVFE